MSFSPDTIVSGQYADIYQVIGASTTFTNSPLIASSVYPRVNKTFAGGTLYKVADRSKKIFDATLDPSAYSIVNGGVVQSPTTYRILGGGYVYFPNSITPSGGTNEVDGLTATGATAGTLTVTLFGITTAAFNFNATTAAVNTAFQNAFGAGNVTVSGAGPLTSGVVVTWSGAYGSMPIGVVAWTLTQIAWTGTSAVASVTTPGVVGLAITGSSIASTAVNVVHLAATRDWKFTKNNAVVQADTYGRGFGRDIPGIPRGTWDFQEMSIDNTVHFYQLVNQAVTLALYENTNVGTGTPRIWICQGYVTQTPVDAALTGPVMASIQGTLIDWPFFLNESL